MSQTWTQFMATVDEHLSVDADRRGLESFRERSMRNAVVDLQRHITAYQQGHTTLYSEADMTTLEYAHLGNLPAGAIPHAFYTYTTELDSEGVAHPFCRRNRMDFWPWLQRQSLICDPCSTRLYAYTISPQGKTFIIHPLLNTDTRLLLVWQGLKINFAAGDTVPFPEESAEAVAAYVKWRILLEIDKNPQLAQAQYGIFKNARSDLYLDERDKLSAEKPDEEYDVGSASAPPTLDAFGAQSVPFLSGITQLSGVDGDVTALSAIPTESLSVNYAVEILIGGSLQTWILQTSTAATAAGYQRPNDYSDPGNTKVWIQAA
jgi:hypothetical protein